MSDLAHNDKAITPKLTYMGQRLRYLPNKASINININVQIN